jgi:predicted protein tyrosine phosphatase
VEKPNFRCGTKRAIEELADELNLTFNSDMQDWSYEVANPNDIEKYILHYNSTTDENKKFVLMEIIIQATNDQNEEADFLKYWSKIKSILQENFTLHEFTIFYWSCFDNQNLNDTWTITLFLRELWNSKKRLKILFVCTINRMRSATAHRIYADDTRFEIKSAGTDKSASTVISLDLLNWADSIVVMEKHHRNFIRQKFADIYNRKKIVCLYIPDDFDYMQPELIGILRDKFEDIYKRGLV